MFLHAAGIPMLRIGFGYDAHRLAEGRTLILGGVQIPHDLGLYGHSDADVLTHAVIDAVLGAMAMGDIGRHFPDTDPQYRGVSSVKLLSQVAAWAADRGFRISNLDASIVAERPRLVPFIPDMVKNLADACGCGTDAVNVKATTTEGMGFCGTGQGMAAYAVVSMVRE